MATQDIILDELKTIKETVTQCRIDIATLKVKSGVWGGLAGLIPGVIGLIMWVLSVQ